MVGGVRGGGGGVGGVRGVRGVAPSKLRSSAAPGCSVAAHAACSALAMSRGAGYGQG